MSLKYAIFKICPKLTRKWYSCETKVYSIIFGDSWRQKVVSVFGFEHTNSHFFAPKNGHCQLCWVQINGTSEFRHPNLVFGLLIHRDNRISKAGSQQRILHFEEHPNDGVDEDPDFDDEIESWRETKGVVVDERASPCRRYKASQLFGKTSPPTTRVFFDHPKAINSFFTNMSRNSERRLHRCFKSKIRNHTCGMLSWETKSHIQGKK